HLCLLWSVFFFCSRVYHLSLLSFPTRRSSDLLAVFICCEVELVGIFEGALEFGDRLLLAVGDHVVGLEAVLDVDGELAEAALLEDRKSTRLNSSHVKISYAVFCLKKKKKQIH